MTLEKAKMEMDATYFNVGCFSSDNVEPDDLLCGMPDAIISCRASCWSTDVEFVPMIEIMVSSGGESVRVVLDESQASALGTSLVRLANSAVQQADDTTERFSDLVDEDD